MKAVLVALALEDLVTAALRLGLTLFLGILVVIAFVIASLISLMSAPLGATAHQPVPVVTSAAGGAGDGDAVRLAYAQLGKPYVWGGASPETSFDCSGLVQWVYRQVGVSLPRTAQQQYNVTQRVDRADLRPGDTVYFRDTYYSPGEPITHVGIYIGNGQMINAPTTGDVVRIMPIFSDSYWNAHYAGAGRVVR